MPRQPTLFENHISNLVAYLEPALSLLTDVHGVFETPFVSLILQTVQALIGTVQSVKRNRASCVQLLENVHQVLFAIVDVHLKSATIGSLPPASLHHIGKFTDTLSKIHTFIEAQLDRKKIKHFFRQSEMNTLLKDCQTELLQAQEAFKIETAILNFTTIEEMKQKAEHMHHELLEVISTVSDGSTSDRSLSLYSGFNGSHNSSNSFSLLPSKPKIFHGRESELHQILKGLEQESPRIAILGGGGMGKTTLARAVLHHENTSARFQHRLFVSAESAATSIELAGLIGLHIGLEPTMDSTKPVVNYFSRQPSSLLILDNLETPWEPMQARHGVEEFLSLLTDIANLALVITMRGSERPGQVSWSHPFLQPLQPLSDMAARQIFVDITDDVCDSEELNRLLRFTDNMPLAVDLIAHLVDYEGLSSVLTRWETERTSLLTAGHNRESNLNASIAISLSSPRLTPGAKELLGLLSILPDGLSDIELVQASLPIPDIRSCKSILLATSLAYSDSKSRLCSLMPIREHMQKFSPPSSSLTKPLCDYFHSILQLYQKYNGVQLGGVVTQITANIGNLQQVLLQRLQIGDPDLVDTIWCTISLNAFTRIAGSRAILLDLVPSTFPQPPDHQLAARFGTEVLMSYTENSIDMIQDLINDVEAHFQHFDDPVLQSKFWRAAGSYFVYHDLSMAMQHFEKALVLSRPDGDINEHCNILLGIAQLKLRNGNYSTAQIHCSKAQRLAHLSANSYQEARALRMMALCSKSFGHYQQSLTLLHQARCILGKCGMSGCITDHNISNAQAEVYSLKSEYIEARKIHNQLMQNTSVDQDVETYAFALLNIAEIDVMIGGAESGIRHNLDVVREILRSRYPPAIVNCDIILAELELRKGNRVFARTAFQNNLKLGLGSNSEVECYCLERLANIHQWGVVDSQLTSNWPVIYLAFAHHSRDKLSLCKAYLFLGDQFSLSMDEETAHNLYTIALEGFTSLDVHCSRAQCMLRLGDIASIHGDKSKAVELWGAARPLFERSSQADGIVELDTRLLSVKNIG